MRDNAVIRGTFEHLFNAMHFQLAIVPGQPPPATQHVVNPPFGLWAVQRGQGGQPVPASCMLMPAPVIPRKRNQRNGRLPPPDCLLPCPSPCVQQAILGGAAPQTPLAQCHPLPNVAQQSGQTGQARPICWNLHCWGTKICCCRKFCLMAESQHSENLWRSTEAEIPTSQPGKSLRK